LDTLKKWPDEEKGRTLPKTALEQAIGYALNNWETLSRYVEQGYQVSNNNLSERTTSSAMLAISSPDRSPQDRLPRTLSAADLQTILDCFDTSAATGRRDLALVRCGSPGPLWSDLRTFYGRPWRGKVH
jgi:hypothetical protein